VNDDHASIAIVNANADSDTQTVRASTPIPPPGEDDDPALQAQYAMPSLDMSAQNQLDEVVELRESMSRPRGTRVRGTREEDAPYQVQEQLRHLDLHHGQSQDPGHDAAHADDQDQKFSLSASPPLQEIDPATGQDDDDPDADITISHLQRRPVAPVYVPGPRLWLPEEVRRLRSLALKIGQRGRSYKPRFVTDDDEDPWIEIQKEMNRHFGYAKTRGWSLMVSLKAVRKREWSWS
jgi:hypothetical protein